MKSLVIDSTADRLVVAGSNGEKTEKYIGDAGARRHTGSILVAIDGVLKKLGIAPMELQYIGIVVGPGSFTGIRIGVATANAMAMASGAKMVGMTSLEPVLFGKDGGLALLDCKHNNFYALARRHGVDDYLALTGDEAAALGLPLYYAGEPDPDGLLKVLNDKICRKEFVPTARPFYIKKSSAEAL